MSFDGMRLIYDDAVLLQDIMENMFWGGEVLKLESVSLQEPKVIEWRETLEKAIHASLIPLKAYADGNGRCNASSLRTVREPDESEHRSIYQVCFVKMKRSIDHITVRFRDFEKSEKSIEEYRNEILMHIREKESLEQSIPSAIIIGPYYVFTQKLRETLSNKRKTLIEALLLSQTRKARNKAEEVHSTVCSPVNSSSMHFS
jgi:dynein heavy chain, axonemal